MARALYPQGLVDASGTTTANTTQYFPCGGSGASIGPPLTTEADVQILQKNAGTFSDLTVSISANSIAATTTVRFRKNGANGNMLISIPASTSGNFTETASSGTYHTDTVASNDKTSLQTTPGASTGTITLVTVSTSFLNTASTDTVTRLSLTSFNNTLTTASTTIYETIAGEMAATSTTTEANAKCRFRKAGTIQNGAVYIKSNTRTSATVFT